MAITVGTILVNVIGNAAGLASTLGAAENTITRFGSGVMRMGSRWTAGVSLPIAGLLTGIAKVGAAFDDQMTQSVAIMSDVDASMRKQMENTAMELSENLRFSATEIAKGYYDLASAGFSAEGALKNIGTVATFAQAGMMDMGTAGEHLAGAVNALGIELIGANDQAGAMARVADVLTKANNNAMGTVEDFSQALTTRFAQGMRTANISLEEGVGLLAAYAQQNIKGKEASMQAWMAIRDLQSKAITASDAWEKYGISVYAANGELRKVPDILDQITLRQKGFSKAQVQKWLETGVRPPDGTAAGKAMSPVEKRTMVLDLKLQDRSVASLMKIVDKGTMIREFTDKLTGAAGEAARVADKQMESVAAKWDTTLNKLSNIGTRLFLEQKSILGDVLDLVNKFLDKLNEWITAYNNLDESTRKWVLGMLAAAVAAGPLLWFAGNFIQLAGGLIKLTGGVATFFAGLTKGMLNYIEASKKAPDVVKMIQPRAANGQFMKAIPAPVVVPQGMEKATGSWTAITTAATGFWGVLKNIGKIMLDIAPRFLAIIGLTSLLWPAIKEVGVQLYYTFDRALKPMGGVKGLWDQLTKIVDGSNETWNRWWETAKNVWHILENLWATAQYGFVLIVRLASAFAEDLDKGVQGAWDSVVGFIKTLGEWWNKITQYISDIPLLGDAFEWVWEKASKGARQLWDVVKEVIQSIAQAILKITGMIASALTPDFLENPLVAAATGLTNIGNNAKDVHEAAKMAADEFDRWLISIGAAVEKSKDLGQGEFGPFEGGDLDQGMFGPFPSDSPLGPGYDHPDRSDKSGAAKRDPVKEAYEQLMGDGGRAWRDVAKAVELHKDEIFKNADAMDRLWEIYKGVRETIGPSGLTKELDALFADRIGVQDMEKISEMYGDLWVDLFNNGEMMSDMEKNLSLIQDFVRQRQSLLKDAGAAGGTVFTSDFFKKYGSDIEKLTKYYASQSDEIKLMIDEYWAWVNAMEATERAGANLKAGQEALGRVVAEHADMAAMLADKQKEFGDAQLKESDRVMRGISRNQEKLKLDFARTNAAMLNSFREMNAAQIGEALKKFLEMQRMQEEYLQTVRDMDLRQLALSVDIDELVVRSFKHMTEAKRKELIKLQVEATKFASTMSKLSSAFAAIASANDPKGQKWITWLATISELMGKARLEGVKLGAGIEAVRVAFGKGDWKGVLSGMVAVFGAIANGIQIMAQATAGANKLKATLGGALAGAQLGFGAGGAIGGPIGALIGAGIGAVGGALVGFFRSSGRAAEEARKKLAELQSRYDSLVQSFVESHPEMRHTLDLFKAMGYTIREARTEADLEAFSRDVEEFNKRIEDIRDRVGGFLDDFEELGIGLPDDIRRAIEDMIALGIVTGDTAEQLARMLGEGEVSWEKMKEAADRYGISEHSLGAAFKQSKINSMAKQLIDDYELLTRGGAEAAAVLRGMAPAINKLILESKAFGTTIPGNMRPWIEELMKAGLLVDENGNKITDLSGINFGPDIVSQFQEITNALRDLIEELRKLPGLFQGIGGNIPAPRMPPITDGPFNPDDLITIPGKGPGVIYRPRPGLPAPGTPDYEAGLSAARAGSVAGVAASTVENTHSQRTLVIVPIAVADATNLDSVISATIAALPEAIADNQSDLKHVIISTVDAVRSR